MLFDDDFFQLTGMFSADKKNNEKKDNSDVDIPGRTQSAPVSTNHEYSNPDSDYVIESDLVVPNIKPVKDETQKPLIVVCDDDFETLDLMTIYLSRNYRYEGFSGPKEAIFFLNQNIPDLVLIDCKIHTMKPTTFMDIVRAGAGNVPFVYIGTAEEMATIEKDFLPEYVIGFLEKPIPRGKLQLLIDTATG